MKVMGVREYPSLQTLFEKTIVKQARKIIADPSHVLYSEYELLPSGRCYRVPTRAVQLIACDSSAIINAILPSLSVNYGSVY